MFRLKLFLVVYLFLFSPKLSHAQERPEYVIGVLRYDGIVEPFASMHDSTWQSISDRDLNYLSWQQPSFYFYISQDSVEKLHIGTQVIFDPNGMNRGKGFISSFSNSSPGQNCCYPKPKAGLVLNWKAEQAIFIKTDSLQYIYPQKASRIKQLFRSSEQENIDNNRQFEFEGESYVSPSIPVHKSLRDTLEIKIQYKITDHPIQGKRFFYFNARRSYPFLGCPSLGELQGWGIINNNKLKLIRQSYTVGDCDGKGLGPSISPHLAFELHGKIYVGTILSYYEGEGRQLFEVVKDSFIPLLSNH